MREEDKPTIAMPPTRQEAKTPETSHGVTRKIQLLAMASIVMLSSAFGFVGGWIASGRPDNGSSSTTQQVVLERQGDLIRDIANRVGESVVSITSVQRVEDGFFAPTEQEGAGTGFILTDDGLIATNRHVVPSGTLQVIVTLSDGTEYENVEVVGRTGSADVLDLAFLKIKDTKGKTLKPVTIGDSSAVRVGDSVVAIGNALGQFQNTVTEGIISGYGRDLQASNGDGSSVSNLENLFQTDAAINEGNSGGPLVNLNGEVIGINTAAVIDDAQNIGFAIPINDVSGLIDSVIETGTFTRPFLGVRYVPLTNDVAEYFDLKAKRGAYVIAQGQGSGSAVVPGGPADKAGVKPGDIITSVNDQDINEELSLAAAVNKFAVGDTVTLSIIRNSKEVKLEATLQAAPKE